MNLHALQPSDRSGVRMGHERLLRTFRKLDADFVDPRTGQIDLYSGRALVAFLRQSVDPFGRIEEAHAVDEPEREALAFEHAFLRAETDALARALRTANARTTGSGTAASPQWSPVLRCLHRIGAALELHVQKFEDAEVDRTSLRSCD